MLKKIVKILCAAFGASLIINAVVMIIFANSTIGSYLTLLVGLVFFLPSVFYSKIHSLFKKYILIRIGTAVLSFFTLATLISSLFLVIYGTSDTVTYNEDYLIVLGCGLRGDKPTEPLRSRLNTALEYLNRNDNCKIIVSGGQGNGEDIPEADAMAKYLIENGVDETRIIKEDKSTSTSENFKFSNDITENSLASEEVAFITNDFHIYRAYNLARIQGFYFNHLHADTSWYNLAPSYLREMLAIAKMIVFKY